MQRCLSDTTKETNEVAQSGIYAVQGVQSAQVAFVRWIQTEVLSGPKQLRNADWILSANLKMHRSPTAAR